MKKFIEFASFSFFASALNYLFQILLAKKLGDIGFLNFSSNWAKLSLLFTLGSFFFYLMALQRYNSQKVKHLLYVTHISSLIFVLFGFFYRSNMYSLSVGLILISTAHAMISGLMINRSKQVISSRLNLLFSVLKIIMLSFINSSSSTVDVFIILYFSFVVTHLLFYLTSKPIVEVAAPSEDKEIPKTILGAFLLAVATNSYPYLDVLWFDFYHDISKFPELSILSIVTKIFFFAQIIITQWLLPILKKDESYERRQLGLLLIIVIFVPILGAVISRSFFSIILQWHTIPDLLSFYLASLSSVLVAVNFFYLQLEVLRESARTSLLLLLIITLGQLVSGLLKINLIIDYYVSTSFFALISILAVYITRVRKMVSIAGKA